MDSFFSKKNCDRCGCDLTGKSRIMSMYNTDCICTECKEKERKRADYRAACDADHEAIRSENYNFPGIGL